MSIASLALSMALAAGLCLPAFPAAEPSAPQAVYEEEPLLPGESFTIDMSFAGDCLLATEKSQSYRGSFAWYASREEPAYFLEKVWDIFSADDFTVVNLENVLTDRPLEAKEKSTTPAYWFKAPARNAEILTAGSVEAVSLANNHTGDYGAKGKADTIAAIQEAGLPYGTNEETIYLEKNGFTVAVICNGLWNEGQASQIVRRIKEASERSDYQIVFYHGGTEGVYQPDPWRVRASRRLADAGADLVVGNHPHVLQPAEVYHGVPIVYSLGNFCYGGSRRPENRTVIYQMRLSVQDGKVLRQEPVIIPCYVYTGKTNNFQPAPITDAAERQRVLDFMAGKAVSPN